MYYGNNGEISVNITAKIIKIDTAKSVKPRMGKS